MGKNSSIMILSVIFALLFVVVFGSTLGTTLEIAEEEQNPGQGQGQRQECSQQLQQQQQLDACQRYLVQSSQPISLSINGEEENSWREEFMRCCPQLEEVEEKCRCEGIKRIVEREKQRGELKGEQMQEMLLTAQTLPALCGRMAPGRCDFPTLLLRPLLSVLFP